MSNFEQIIDLSDECVRLCGTLSACFATERKFFVEFKMEEMLATSAEKERLLAELTQKRHTLKGYIATFTAGSIDNEDFERQLDESQAAIWRSKNAEWKNAWEVLYACGEKNQGLFKHSLRNLDAIVDNLKRLFGLHGTYTAKGTRQDLSPRGSVVRGSY